MRAGTTPTMDAEQSKDQTDLLNDTIPQALFAARDRFRGLIVERIIFLEAQRIDVQNGRDPQKAVENMASVSHKIAGVAATLGFAEAGKQAAELEAYCYAAVDHKVSINTLWPQIEPTLILLMDELEALLDA